MEPVVGRHMKRRALPASLDVWRAVRDGNGQWVVVNASGAPLLTHPDPLIRLTAAWRMAAANELYAALEDLTKRLAAIESPYTRDQRRLLWAALALATSRAPYAEIERLAAQPRQYELTLVADPNRERKRGIA